MPWGVIGAAAAIVGARAAAKRQEEAAQEAQFYFNGEQQLRTGDPLPFDELIRKRLERARIHAICKALPDPALIVENDWWPYCALIACAWLAVVV